MYTWNIISVQESEFWIQSPRRVFYYMDPKLWDGEFLAQGVSLNELLINLIMNY